MKRLMVILLCMASLVPISSIADEAEARMPPLILGITLDDSVDWVSRGAAVAAALDGLPVRPVIRIVMDRAVPPASYLPLCRLLDGHGDIMACPVDATELSAYDLPDYEERFREAYAALSPHVHIWEVGNEVNGVEWIREAPRRIMEKVAGAAMLLKNIDPEVQLAMTAYCTPPGQADLDMVPWLTAYMPEELSDALTYLMVSYYEDDNEGYQPQWGTLFSELSAQYPHLLLAVGECGNTSPDATNASKAAMAARYYSMPRYVDQYVGGYFWWFFGQDCIPHQDNPVWQAIHDGFLQRMAQDAAP